MMKEEEKLYTKELYDLSHTAAAPLLEGTTYPWEALPQIGAFIRELGAEPLPGGVRPAGGGCVDSQDGQNLPQQLHRRPLRHRAGNRGAPRGLLSGATPWWGHTAWWAIPPS